MAARFRLSHRLEILETMAVDSSCKNIGVHVTWTRRLSITIVWFEPYSLQSTMKSTCQIFYQRCTFKWVLCHLSVLCTNHAGGDVGFSIAEQGNSGPRFQHLRGASFRLIINMLKHKISILGRLGTFDTMAPLILSVYLSTFFQTGTNILCYIQVYHQ